MAEKTTATPAMLHALKTQGVAELLVRLDTLANQTTLTGLTEFAEYLHDTWRLLPGDTTTAGDTWEAYPVSGHQRALTVSFKLGPTYPLYLKQGVFVSLAGDGLHPEAEQVRQLLNTEYSDADKFILETLQDVHFVILPLTAENAEQIKLGMLRRTHTLLTTGLEPHSVTEWNILHQLHTSRIRTREELDDVLDALK